MYQHIRDYYQRNLDWASDKLDLAEAITNDPNVLDQCHAEFHHYDYVLDQYNQLAVFERVKFDDVQWIMDNFNLVHAAYQHRLIDEAKYHAI